jgi:hypothetical protein
MPKYRVNIIRIVTWTATVVIDAENKDKAADIAQAQANKAINEGRADEYAVWELDDDIADIEIVSL